MPKWSGGCCSQKIFKIHSFDCNSVTCWLGSKLQNCQSDCVYGSWLLQWCSTPYYVSFHLQVDMKVCSASKSSGCYHRFLLWNFELHAWTMWFWRSLQICQFHNFKEWVSAGFMLPDWLVQQDKTNSEKKELHDLVDQITKEIPFANSTLHYSFTRDPPHFRMIKKMPIVSQFYGKFMKPMTFLRTVQHCIHNFDDIG